MGGGIAQVAARASMEVGIFDAEPSAAGKAIDAIAARLAGQVERARITEEERDAALARLRPVRDLGELREADAVIEAVVEDLDVKRRIFATLAGVVTSDALLATNTSALPITAIAASSGGPERIIGMHFFSPVPAMSLCEIVRGLLTSDAAVARAVALAEALGKEAIVVNRDDAGFVTSRLITVLIQEAVGIVEQGIASPSDVDRACELAFGHRLGPLATADLTGLDVALNAGRVMYEQTGDARYKPPQLMSKMVAAGRLGRKAGKGFHDYE